MGSLSQLIAWWSRRLESRRFAAVAALAVFGLGVAAQALVHARVLAPRPAIAGGYCVSSALGLLHGHGFSVRPEEAEAAKQSDPHADLLALYDPDAPRTAPHEPLPGVPLLFAALAKLRGGLTLAQIVQFQILLHAAGAALLLLALRKQHPLAATIAGAGWALYLPYYRSTLAPGYDLITSVVYLGAALGLVTYRRSGHSLPLVIAGVACGAGLWVRSYLFVVPLAGAAVLLLFGRAGLRSLALFLLPTLLLGAGLYGLRSSAEGTNPMIRGGVWHSFWAGVGQFENDRGVTDLDDSVRSLAERLAPGHDFNFPNYQYDATYDDTLGQAARAFAAEHPLILVRNALHRLLWLWCPSFGPSRTLAASPAMRAAFIALGLPISLLALVGFGVALRRDPAWALLLAVPWLSLLPLVPYYFITKVPAAAFFVQLVFAGIAVEAAAARWVSREDPPRG